MNCSNLRRIYCDPGTVWTAAQSGNMFKGCTSLKGYCPERTTDYDANYLNITYARVCTPEEDGYFTSTEYMPDLLGDVNGDGLITIADATSLIDYVLTKDSTGLNLLNADCDGNDIIGVADVTAIIDFILNGTWP
jgi:hypothetical protein